MHDRLSKSRLCFRVRKSLLQLNGRQASLKQVQTTASPASEASTPLSLDFRLRSCKSHPPPPVCPRPHLPDDLCDL